MRQVRDQKGEGGKGNGDRGTGGVVGWNEWGQLSCWLAGLLLFPKELSSVASGVGKNEDPFFLSSKTLLRLSCFFFSFLLYFLTYAPWV